MSRVLVALRIHAGDNRKHRPAWYSKTGCITSLTVAIELARQKGVEIQSLAFVDTRSGPLSPALEECVSSFDTRIAYSAGSSRRSWQKHLRLLRPYATSLAPDDIVYLVEDDHFHHPDAILALAYAPSDYALLYSLSKQEETILGRGGGFTWVETLRGVSSFGVKAAALRRDGRMLSWMANAGPAFDMLTWQVARGRTFFTGRQIIAPFNPEPPFERTGLAKSVYQVAWRLFANLYSFVRPRRPLGAVAPSLATHAEDGWLAPGQPWDLLAGERHES